MTGHGFAADHFDDIIIGAGHNGLTAAAYLAQAGRSVLVLERADHVGGASVSAIPFPGMPARLSRFSYLVSLMPRRIIADLGLDIRLIRRRFSSFTPLPSDPSRGILVDAEDDIATAESFWRATGSDDTFGAWEDFYGRAHGIAERTFSTLTEPLRTVDDISGLLADHAPAAEFLSKLISRPLGDIISEWFDDDVVRGIVATDGLIGTFADLTESSLRQNICFLYHVIGGGTGDWDVPIGGMGAVSGALYQAAASGGAEVHTGIRLIGVDPDDGTVETDHGTVTGTVIYGACAPQIINHYLDDPIVTENDTRGAQLKINLLLDRLPHLLDPSVSPEAAFSGTLHINETYDQLQTAWRHADHGVMPELPPCEIYCHTLSDRSILGPELDGKHTLTLFGLHTPPEVFDEPGAVEHAVGATLASVNSILAEPIQNVIAHDTNGNPCIEIKTPQDLEEMLWMPGGNIFHRSLQWPWAETDDEVGAWGVETRHPRLLMCGAGARRGGGVSGIPGHNAAAKTLTEE